MLKYILYVILVLVLIGGAAGVFHLYRVAQKNKKEMAAFMNGEIKLKKKFPKTLVVYYSLSGNTRAIAEKIQAKTGADIYEIKTAEVMTANPVFYAKVKKQLKSGTYPALAGEMPDLKKYNLIFVGAPVWWYTMATPMYSFLERVDFQNKAVVPFSTQGSNPGTYLADFKKAVRNARVYTYESFNNLSKEYERAVDNKINQWLNNL
ncbi:MAG: NAD(P)H-dependent oxidoreductase [Lactobacillales bacterium]|jgi:flavodoxin|nr:NAD(P)H-dependent oxidoreductase [Lactobacillales bacterium]